MEKNKKKAHPTCSMACLNFAFALNITPRRMSDLTWFEFSCNPCASNASASVATSVFCRAFQHVKRASTR
jgi:hypothetical protein